MNKNDKFILTVLQIEKITGQLIENLKKYRFSKAKKKIIKGGSN